MTEVSRTFALRKFDGAKIGAVVLSAPKGKWALDGQELSQASVEYLMTFALQSLQDAYAGADTLAEAKAAFAKKLDAVKNGTIGVRTGGGGTDPLTAMMRQIARSDLKAALIASGKGTKGFTAMDKAAQAEILDKVIAKDPERYEKGAKAELRARAEAAKKAADAVDLGALGLE